VSVSSGLSSISSSATSSATKAAEESVNDLDESATEGVAHVVGILSVEVLGFGECEDPEDGGCF
jgi:hypothetical protein